MRNIIVSITLLLIVSLSLAQTQLKPSVTDNGGGIISNSSYKLLASIGQSVTGLREDGINLEAGYITAELDLTGIYEPQFKPPVAPTISEFFPNPFNSATRIGIFLPKPDKISLQLFDLSGKQVYTWEQEKLAGSYSITFTANAELPSGTYLYKVSVSEMQKSGKIILVR